MTILLQIKYKNEKQTFLHFKGTCSMLIWVKSSEVSSVYTGLLYIIPNMHIFLRVILEGYLHRSFMTVSLKPSLEQIIKVYLHYKMITLQNVSSEAQVIIFFFLFHQNFMFHFQDIQVFVFLTVPWFTNYVIS